MLIEDGTGTGFTAKVRSDHSLRVYATIELEPHLENQNGNAYTLLAAQTPNGPDPSAGTFNAANFLYIKNLSEITMVVTSIRFWSESNEYIDLFFDPDGDPVGGEDIIPINANLGSGNQANGIFQEGENIEGLTGGALFDRFRIPGDSDDHVHRPDSKIIIPRNSSIVLRAGNGGSPIEVSLEIYYHEES